MTWSLPAWTVLYPPRWVEPVHRGIRPPEGYEPERVGSNQLDILLRCRRSPGWGTLIQRHDLNLQTVEIVAAKNLQRRGLIEFRQFGGTCIGWLWVALLTEVGRDSWLGFVPNKRIDS